MNIQKMIRIILVGLVALIFFQSIVYADNSNVPYGELICTASDNPKSCSPLMPGWEVDSYFVFKNTYYFAWCEYDTNRPTQGIRCAYDTKLHNTDFFYIKNANIRPDMRSSNSGWKHYSYGIIVCGKWLSDIPSSQCPYIRS